jgi:Recombination endonuclease VII
MTKKYIPGKYFTGELCKNGHISERWNYNGMCVECKREADRSSNLKAGKRYWTKKNYGLSMDQVVQMKEAQDHKCAVCGDVFGNEYKTQIDHCHVTKKVRGLLCINCNWLLGKSRDNPDLLRRAADYLERCK